MKKNLSPLPEIVCQLFREDDSYIAAGWYGFLYPETPSVISYSIFEFLASHNVLKRLGNELKVKVDEMEYEVRIYTAPESFLEEIRVVDGIRLPKNPLKTWLLTRSLARGMPEELAELVLTTYSPITSTPIAQAIRAKLLSLITGKEPVIDLRLEHPIILRYGDIDVNVDWLNDLWKRGIMLYLDEWSAKRAVKKLVATVGWKYIIQ